MRTVAQIEDCDVQRIEGDYFYIMDHEDGADFFPGETVSVSARVVPTIKARGNYSSTQSHDIWGFPSTQPPPPYTTSMSVYDEEYFSV